MQNFTATGGIASPVATNQGQSDVSISSFSGASTLKNFWSSPKPKAAPPLPQLSRFFVPDVVAAPGPVDFEALIAGVGSLVLNLTVDRPLQLAVGGQGTLAAALARQVALSVVRNEIRTLTITDLGAISGTFTLTFKGQVTAPIAFNANAAAVQAALELLSNIDPGDVVVTDQALGGGETLKVRIEFTGQHAGIDILNAEFSIQPGGLSDASSSLANTQQGGGIAGVGLLAAALDAPRAFAAAIAGVGTLAADLIRDVAVQLAVAGVGTLAANLIRDVALALGLAGQGNLADDLSVQGQVNLDAAIAGGGTLAAALTASRELQLLVLGGATVLPALTSLAALQVLIAGGAQLSPTLTVTTPGGDVTALLDTRDHQIYITTAW